MEFHRTKDFELLSSNMLDLNYSQLSVRDENRISGWLKSKSIQMVHPDNGNRSACYCYEVLSCCEILTELNKDIY